MSGLVSNVYHVHRDRGQAAGDDPDQFAAQAVTGTSKVEIVNAASAKLR